MVKLYVEGGGDTAALKTACREGFTTFVTNAGIKNRPRIVACGSRRDAFDSFCTAIAGGQEAILLVDSEDVITAQNQQGTSDTWQPWAHLKTRTGDGWDKPQNTPDTDCHLMAQIMESWFLADRNALKTFFGQGFKESALPAANNAVESIAKQQVYNALGQATKSCKTKTAYGKGEHSFKLLTKIDPAKVTQASPWAKRFVDELRKKMDA
ncbi:hypothetical protein FHS82_003172 [Pseudochelatococcus lubricantis]|uniref:DUF4276 family protein n=1 Tax=Pseudochelatococcus lubricantis TaxID=1538102 RepID=A0ABX0V2G3_9HYPH|nr:MULTISPECIES: DUF4276 family protein [Alphaproteobacteria]NIJ59317.1 hypothetical protein [Pseudochelatococcus lubricantis]